MRRGTVGSEERAYMHAKQIRQIVALTRCSAATLLTPLQMEGPPLLWTSLPVYDSIIDDASSHPCFRHFPTSARLNLTCSNLHR